MNYCERTGVWAAFYERSYEGIGFNEDGIVQGLKPRQMFEGTTKFADVQILSGKSFRSFKSFKGDRVVLVEKQMSQLFQEMSQPFQGSSQLFQRAIFQYFILLAVVPTLYGTTLQPYGCVPARSTPFYVLRSILKVGTFRAQYSKCHSRHFFTEFSRSQVGVLSVKQGKV